MQPFAIRVVTKATVTLSKASLYTLVCVFVVCITTGYHMSYWNLPYFPESCGDIILDDNVTFDTMVRIAGSHSGISRTFKAIANMYGWAHIVLVSDDESTSVCWRGAKPFDKVIGLDENFTFMWLRLADEPTDEQLDSILDQIRSCTRGLWLLSPRGRYFHFNNCITTYAVV